METQYSLFFDFINKYEPDAFTTVDESDPLMIKLEKMMEENKQFFYVGDFTRLSIIYSSKRCLQMYGLRPDEMDPRNIFKRTHPDDLKRHGVGRSKGFERANEIYSNPKDDYAVISSNYRFMNLQGEYRNLLLQGYFFKSKKSALNVYGILVHTDISWFEKMKFGFNIYMGKNLSYFRFPDEELIMTGCVFTEREFEILKLIKEGQSSEQIGQKLFLSPHTIDTHRRNILKKTNSSSTSELIIELMERGVL
ncbi:MAG TPA: LuxR C-terminal-related transcriptional regulator [Bacteroidales bacterium]